MLWNVLLVLLYLSPCCYCLLHYEVLQVLRSLESWASKEFQGIPRFHLSEVFNVHQVIKQNDSYHFPGVIELCSSKAESHRRNWAHGHLGNGETKVILCLVDWACPSVLCWPQCAARVQRRLFIANQCAFWAGCPLRRGRCAHSGPWSITTC